MHLKYCALLAGFLYALFFSFDVVAQDAAAPNLCQPNLDVPINVTPVFGEPTFDFTASIPQLQELSRDAYHVIPEGLALGLTHYQLVSSINPVSSARDLPDGTTCVRVEHVDITFGYTNVIVYVAGEIPQGTCGFNQVMAHEQKHITVQQKILSDFVPKLQEKLKHYLAENGALQNQNYTEALNWIHDNVESIAENTMADLMTENTRLQHNIDTIEEYTQVGNSCGGQLHEIVRNFMRTGQ